MSDSPFEARLKAAYGLATASPGAGAQAPVSAPRVDAPPPREKLITVSVYVLGINQEYDEPDVFDTQVTCTEQEYYEEGQHLMIAEERAREAGFTDPLFSFDERETRITGRLSRLLGG